jgi:hypothetical protein
VRRPGVIAGILLALLAAPAQADWAAPQRLAGPGDEGTHNRWVLTGNDAGDRLLAYDTVDGMRVRLARPGRGFGGELAVPGSVGGEPNSAAVSRRGDVVLGWSYFVEEEYDCCWRLALSSRRAGGRFGARRTITPREEDTSFIEVVAGPGGDVAVSAIGFERTYSVFGRFGALGPTRVLPQVDCCEAYTSVDAAGRAQFAYRPPSSRDIMTVTRSRDGRIGPARRVYRAVASLVGAGITSDARGAAVLALLENTKQRFSRRVRLTAVVRGRDGTFGQRRELEPPGELAEFPLVTSATGPSGASVIAWSPDEGDREIVRAALRRPGRPFGGAVTLRPAQYEGQLHALDSAINAAGLAVVAWRAITPEDSVGIYAAVALPGRSFSEPRLISREGGGLVDGFPSALVDRAGRVTVAWQQGQSIVAAAYRP